MVVELIIDVRKEMKTLFNKIYHKFDWGIGRQLSYHENDGEIYSPIKAGMDMQQIWDNMKEIMKLLDFKWSNIGDKVIDLKNYEEENNGN